ncbi:cob(I)yrinic acid a,c-diamide adenosyltransferase [Sporomusa acidovorans]|uniref:Corrinoid adenosyltransferase n=1 Tax=Sporomusa acidovorans (strain ATCC 49682 / DSM 3132 / Mol) TaxID=1123286 RepID=A0ABZ3J3W5_SPOA4|nr:cob(I)yrinic acid a,c-diamide adenosyltransferase [Sporomusa acidovorans]OZC20261.1 Cob(I)yrinic acid a,c-diamide adenosyltransferase [Sporomusa acidovorans DSM 3132]SDD40279.1 cob(I)alamin adenosyltransferase [Sporomusa acidovorans]
MSKVYTKTGDKGTTSLLTGERVSKTSARVEAYGTVDEINSALGLARAHCTKTEVKDTILKLQNLLMSIMADLASTGGDKEHYVTAGHVTTLEQIIDEFDSKLPPLKNFIIPGETPGAAALDLARTVTRRAERQTLRLKEQKADNNVTDDLLISLNRLSDLCFVLSRYEAESK